MVHKILNLDTEKYGSWVPLGPKPTITVLARACSNLIDRQLNQWDKSVPSRERERPIAFRPCLSLQKKLHFKTHKSLGENNQYWLSWRGPAAIYPTDRQNLLPNVTHQILSFKTQANEYISGSCSKMKIKPLAWNVPDFRSFTFSRAVCIK
jgi:hypothetical protein